MFYFEMFWANITTENIMIWNYYLYLVFFILWNRGCNRIVFCARYLLTLLCKTFKVGEIIKNGLTAWRESVCIHYNRLNNNKIAVWYTVFSIRILFGRLANILLIHSLFLRWKYSMQDETHTNTTTIPTTITTQSQSSWLFSVVLGRRVVFGEL